LLSTHVNAVADLGKNYRQRKLPQDRGAQYNSFKQLSNAESRRGMQRTQSDTDEGMILLFRVEFSLDRKGINGCVRARLRVHVRGSQLQDSGAHEIGLLYAGPLGYTLVLS
jgi:hypothetical protein